MGADKGGAKSGGFFNLFDWNKKSRKKLFSGVSPEGAKQVKRIDDNLPTARLHLIDDDEVNGVSSGKGSSDYSCASSVTDEEGIGIRAPGVVARLMGLDTMPTSGSSEPYTTPLLDTRSLQDNHYHKKGPEFYMDDQFKQGFLRGESNSRKLMELRSQKMPSSPVERFQTEILPHRSAKPISMAHHKLLSPIKNPGFISPKNAAHIMEAAAKILEPGFQASSSKGKSSPFTSSSIPLKAPNPRESLSTSQRAPGVTESARRPVDSSDLSYLRGQPLNRTWNGSEDIAAFRGSPESQGIIPTNAKGKGKSVSLAVQAKVNVQRREGLSATSKSTLDQRDRGECKSSQTFKSQPSNQKNKAQKKPPAPNSSGVLRQNNQKQNCPSGKGRSASKQLTSSNQQGRKILSGDVAGGKNKTLSKLSGNSRVVYKKEGLESASLDREGSLSSNKDFPQKKRLIDRSLYVNKIGFSDNILVVGRHEKHVRPNVMIDEHLRWTEDNRREAMDVVSFTFTSPLRKQTHGSGSSTQAVEKLDRKSIYASNVSSEKNVPDSNDKGSSSFGLNVISGDALSLLLEQKLRELTAGVELSDCNFANSGTSTASPTIEESSTSSCILSVEGAAEHKNGLPLGPCKDKPGTIFGYGACSSSGHIFATNHKPWGVEEVCRSSNDAHKELDHQQPSPLSTLEAPFSNESCNSSDSSARTDETNLCSSSIQAQDGVSFNCTNKISRMETEMELSDSASSAITKIVGAGYASEKRSGYLIADHHDLEYVREFVQRTLLMSKDIGACYATSAAEPLDLFLFDKLDSKRRWTVNVEEDKEIRLRRKMIFDCVKECLDLRRRRYFRAGFRAWARGVAVVGKELAEEIHQEISGWKSMGDWMVDELVDKDMSSHVGRWVDFENEAFETGAEIEHEIISSLVDEVVADFLCEIPC